MKLELLGSEGQKVFFLKSFWKISKRFFKFWNSETPRKKKFSKNSETPRKFFLKKFLFCFQSSKRFLLVFSFKMSVSVFKSKTIVSVFNFQTRVSVFKFKTIFFVFKFKTIVSVFESITSVSVVLKKYNTWSM